MENKRYCVNFMHEGCEYVEDSSLDRAIEHAMDRFMWNNACNYPELLSVEIVEGDKFIPVFRVDDVVIVDMDSISEMEFGNMEVGCVTSVDGNVVEVNIFGENAPHLKFVNGKCEFNRKECKLVRHAMYDDLIEYIRGGY